jgi:hypothetical protein
LLVAVAEEVVHSSKAIHSLGTAAGSHGGEEDGSSSGCETCRLLLMMRSTQNGTDNLARRKTDAKKGREKRLQTRKIG